MKIMVLNLNRNTDEPRLEKLFAKYGTVSSCVIVTDKVTGKSKGFGFVEMEDEIAANSAVKALHGSLLSGNKIRVKISASDE